MKTNRRGILKTAAFCVIVIFLAGCSTTKTSTIKLSGTPGLEFSGHYGTETGTPMEVSGTLPMSIEVNSDQLQEVEFRKSNSEGELVMQISSGPLSKIGIIATSEHAGVRGTVNEDGIWKLSNFH